MLSIDYQSFINKNLEEWSSDAEYSKEKEICENMRVTNDTAERGVALMQEYNQLHTVDEEQKQYLMLVVKKNRNKFPNVKKTTLLRECQVRK